MKKIATAALAVGVLLVPLSIGAASAAPAPTAAKAYSSCTAMNKAYPIGVRKTSSAVNRHARQLDRPLAKRTIVDRKARPVSAATYAKNTRLDFDKDGIVCER